MEHLQNLCFSRGHRVRLCCSCYRVDPNGGGFVPSIGIERSKGSGTNDGSSYDVRVIGAFARAGDISLRCTHFRVGGSLRTSLAGTAVDEIMKIGGWKTERVARYYIGAASSASATIAKRKREESSRRETDGRYETTIGLPLSPAFREDFSACQPRYIGGIVKFG